MTTLDVAPCANGAVSSAATAKRAKARRTLGMGSSRDEKDEGLSSICSRALPKVSFRELRLSWHDSVTLTRGSSGLAAPACRERAAVRVRVTLVAQLLDGEPAVPDAVALRVDVREDE